MPPPQTHCLNQQLVNTRLLGLKLVFQFLVALLKVSNRLLLFLQPGLVPWLVLYPPHRARLQC